MPKEWLPLLDLEVMPWKKEQPQRFSSPELYRFLKQVSEQVLGFKPRGPRYFESFDDRIPSEVNLNALPKESVKSNEELPLSVIIPTYNNREFVTRVVSALLQQSLDKDQYEIIVVDDGSSDNSLQSLRALAAAEDNLIVLDYERKAEAEKRGEIYRAGLSRNYGATISRGRKLLFIDSDILVPQDFLQRILQKSQTADVIQCPRYHIKPAAYRAFKPPFPSSIVNPRRFLAVEARRIAQLVGCYRR